MPRLLDGEFDPFMVIEAQKTQREMARQTRNMRYIRLPKTSRGRGRTVDTEKEPGFVAVAILSNPANNTYSRPSTGAGLASAVGRYRSHINSRGGARSRQGGSRGGGGGCKPKQSEQLLGDSVTLPSHLTPQQLRARGDSWGLPRGAHTRISML